MDILHGMDDTYKQILILTVLIISLLYVWPIPNNHKVDKFYDGKRQDIMFEIFS